jgi:NADH-quinone oxidoreductase subunit N
MTLFQNIIFTNWSFLPEIFLMFILPFFILFVLVSLYNSTLKKNLIFTNFWFNFILIIYFFLVLSNVEVAATGFNSLLHTNFFINSAKLILIVVLFFLNHFANNSLQSDNLFNFEYYFLISTAFLGSVLTISAGNFITFILALELQSLSLYVLIGLKTNSILSLEAALKYFLVGTVSSIITFVGIFFIFLYFNTLSFFELKNIAITESNFEDFSSVWPFMRYFLFAIIFFKAAIFPFQFWAPDVYQTAQTGVVAFLTTVSKLTIVIFVIRIFCLDILFLDPFFWSNLFTPFLVLTVVIGTFRGLLQTNLKRVLAYSSMLHISFIFLALTILKDNNHMNNFLFSGPIAETLRNLNLTELEKIKVATFTLALFYLLIYVFLNAIFFAALMILKKATFQNQFKEIKAISDLVGLFQTNPIISFVLLGILLSLAGLPPFLGFYSKYFFILQLVDHNQWFLALILLLLSIISTFYYIKIIKAIFFEKSQNLSDLTLNLTLIPVLDLIQPKQFFILSKISLILLLFVSFLNLFGSIFFFSIYLIAFNLALQLILNTTII